MKSLIISSFIEAGIIFGGVSSFAITKQYAEYVVTAPTEIVGGVADYNNEQRILTIRGKGGQIYLIEIPDSRMIRDLRIGDNVIVKVENGKAVSIEKTKKY
jgi:hypothetical protein